MGESKRTLLTSTRMDMQWDAGRFCLFGCMILVL